MTVRDDDTAATYHIVRYPDPSVANKAINLTRNASVELSLSSVGYRANAWQVDRLREIHRAGEDFI
jgi:hypothetical protein